MHAQSQFAGLHLFFLFLKIPRKFDAMKVWKDSGSHFLFEPFSLLISHQATERYSEQTRVSLDRCMSQGTDVWTIFSSLFQRSRKDLSFMLNLKTLDLSHIFLPTRAFRPKLSVPTWKDDLAGVVYPWCCKAIPISRLFISPGWTTSSNVVTFIFRKENNTFPLHLPRTPSPATESSDIASALPACTTCLSQRSSLYEVSNTRP